MCLALLGESINCMYVSISMSQSLSVTIKLSFSWIMTHLSIIGHVNFFKMALSSNPNFLYHAYRFCPKPSRVHIIFGVVSSRLPFSCDLFSDHSEQASILLCASRLPCFIYFGCYAAIQVHNLPLMPKVKWVQRSEFSQLL